MITNSKLLDKFDIKISQTKINSRKSYEDKGTYNINNINK